MKVLVGCEESQVVCAAFRRRGHEAFSNDLLPTRGDHPEWHLQMDVKEAVAMARWDLIILHPDCTAMAVSGNRWYGRGCPYHQKRIEAVAWTVDLWNKATAVCDRVALENPVSVLFRAIPAAQYIQPWQFGHGETKKTGLALHGLPKLRPTNIVPGRKNRIHMMPGGKDQKRKRSITYQGIADAMADQWSI